MRLTVFCHGQITYSIPNNTKNVTVSIENDIPMVIADDEVIESMRNVRIGDFLVKLDPKDEIMPG